MRFDLVVFDLDGTLVDSVPDIAFALGRALAVAGLPPASPESVRDWVGEGARRLVERAMPPGALPAEVDAVLAGFVAEYGARVCEESRVYPGIVEALERLDGRLPMCVLTNKPDRLTRAVLEGLGLGGRFREVIGEGGRFPRKPDPAALQHLMTVHGASAVRTLLVGDGIPDVQTAHAAGAQVAAVTWGYTPRERLEEQRPDFLLESPSQIPSLVAVSSS